MGLLLSFQMHGSNADTASGFQAFPGTRDVSPNCKTSQQGLAFMSDSAYSDTARLGEY